jgi:hypothetical protein
MGSDLYISIEARGGPDYSDLRAFAALVESLLADGCEVRVWCWDAQ